jgi:purine-nucleoside phosphorylase
VKRAAKEKITGAEIFERAERAAKFIRSKTKLRPQVALVLGSGLGAFADEFTGAVRIDYKKIPDFPRSTALQHAGRLVIGMVAGIPVVAMQGRVHFYEGYSMQQVTFPMRVLGRLGVKAVILTNAAGAINTAFQQGALVVLRDHINFQGTNPLIGAHDDRLGVMFPDMSRAYDRDFRSAALEEGGRLGLQMFEGVYAAVTGPSYETPAEIRFFRTAGADLVGMSTVPEVIVARHMGMRVLGISCATNMAAGVLDQLLSAEEVFETTARVNAQFMALLLAVIPRMARLITQRA